MYINNLIFWLQRLFGVQTVKAVQTEDVPERPEARLIYLIGDEGVPWSAAFLCPCGCRSLIQLSLLKNDSPHWSAYFHRGAITLHPSVWRTKGCRSHFFVREGAIKWVRAKSPPDQKRAG